MGRIFIIKKKAKEEVKMEVARQMGLYQWADSGLYLFDE